MKRIIVSGCITLEKVGEFTLIVTNEDFKNLLATAAEEDSCQFDRICAKYLANVNMSDASINFKVYDIF
jgi:hypothetical protein